MPLVQSSNNRTNWQGNFAPTRLRQAVLNMAFAGNAVHIGPSFSLIELLSVLHRKHLDFPHNQHDHPERDYLVLSKGHGVMAQYSCLLERDWITPEQVETYFGDGTTLMGLSDARVPGLEVTAGSLGHGLSVGVGLALSAKLRGSTQKMFAIVGDGELNEGPIWEACLFAAHHELSNATVIVDANGFQAMGSTQDVMQLGDLQSKFESFGFDAVTVDGHDMDQIDQALITLGSAQNSRPKAVIAKTVKGKGVSFMENDNTWHYRRLDSETLAAARAELS